MQVEKMRTFIIKFLFYCIILGLIYVCFKYILPVLTPFIIGFIIAFVLKRPIDKIAKKTKQKRRIVAILTLTVFYLLLTTLCIVAGSRLIVFLRDLFYSLPTFYSRIIEPALVSLQAMIEDTVQHLDPNLLATVESLGQHINSSLSDMVTSISAGALGLVTAFVGALPAFFVGFLITIVASFFCVVDYYTITSFIVRQLPPKGREMLFKIKDNGIDVLFKFAKAYALLLSLTFIELAIGLTLLRVDYSFLLAALIALVDILPVLGTGTILVPWGVVNLILGNLPLGIGLLVLYAIITVVRQSLEPRVVGKQIGLYPLITLICMFLGSYLFGFVGLFGLPIAVTVFVQLSRSEGLHWIK